MNIGYARISTKEQNVKRQIVAFDKLDIEKIFIDECSGKNTNREQLKLMLDYVREGDTIYIESFSRLARSTKDLLDIVELLKSKKVELISLKENLDTTTPAGKLMLTVIAGIYEFERECLLERQREGIEIAKSEGKYKGRKKIQFPLNFESVYNDYIHRRITATKAMKLLDLKRNTFYRLKKEYEEKIKES